MGRRAPLRGGHLRCYFSSLARAPPPKNAVEVTLPIRRTAPRARAAALLAPLAAALLGASCSDSKREDRAASAAPAYVASDIPRAPIEASGYAPDAPTEVGSVRGTVEIEGDAPADTVVRPISDQEVCGDSVVDVRVDHDGPRLGGAIVWLGGVKGGKRLPLERRYDLNIEGCSMLPRTQAVLAGGTLNVYNADKALHRARFVRQGTRDAVAMASYSDDGQVVPVSAALARPGLVEVRCDLHPWSRAWVAVFDQPYFAVTLRDGAFALDSVPPGRYDVIAWHPRLGVVKDTVRVVAGQDAVVTLRLKASR